jgi:hypothetical protein
VVHKGLRELSRCFRLFQQGQVLKNFQPFGSCRRIARLALPQDNLRDIQLKLTSPLVSPVARNLLMGNTNQIAARLGSQVARNRRFQVNPRLHGLIVTGGSSRFNDASGTTPQTTLPSRSARATYFMSPGVRQAVGNTGQGPTPLDPRVDYMEVGLLESVIKPGRIHRPTPKG